MRVLDPHTPLHPPSGKKRGRKEPTIDYFFKGRMKVPVDTPEGPGRFLDDWAPNLVGPEGVHDEVEVAILGWRTHYKENATEPAYRVCVWGGDDLGMECDYHWIETTPLVLLRMVLLWPEPLTKTFLRSIGFKYS